MPQSIEAGSVNIDIKVLNDDEYIETYFKTNTNSQNGTHSAWRPKSWKCLPGGPGLPYRRNP